MLPTPQPIDPNVMADRMRRCEARLAQIEDQLLMANKGKHRPTSRPWRFPELSMGQYLTAIIILAAIGTAIQLWKAREGRE